MSARSRASRLPLASIALGAWLLGCSSTPGVDPEAPDGGTAEVDGSVAPPTGPACGRLTTPCAEGGACEGAQDCESKLCVDAKCKGVAPADGTKNGDETDVDCGGTAAPACSDGKGCKVASDCTSGVCTAGVCQAPTASDGVQNGDETGVDCGGSTTKAPRCPAGSGCLSDADCDNVLCDTTQKKCKAAAHDDGIKNLDETGIDCGGPTPTVARCATGQGCAADTDCDNVLCDKGASLCAAPTSTDGLKNGTETDVDCGGGAPTNAPKCAIGLGCAANADCSSDGCSAALGNKCSPKSCATAETAGIKTCGGIETGQAGAAAAQESCCKSLVLPTRNTRRLDKYEITSGRFRAFLTSVGPNVRAWVTAYAAANPGSQLASLASTPITDGTTTPPTASTLATLYPNADRFVAHSLTAHMTSDIDNYNGIRGCYNGDGSYSANTYWNDAVHMADFGLPPRSLPRAVSDEKPLNCAMPIMFAAFCAWDGGELALLADFQDAWGATTYPWGAADIYRPKYNWCNGPYRNGNFTCQCSVLNPNRPASCQGQTFDAIGESGVFYEWPRNTDRSKDNEPLIAAPGRMVDDATALKAGGESWMDLAGNLAEYTGDFNSNNQTFCDLSVTPNAGATTCTRSQGGGTGTLYTGLPRSGIVGSTWEGHAYGRGRTSGFAVTFQYGKFGARCARPAAPF